MSRKEIWDQNIICLDKFPSSRLYSRKIYQFLENWTHFISCTWCLFMELLGLVHDQAVFLAFEDALGVVSYDWISVEFNNSDRPGGAAGSMNIETGVFTTVTSGYYIITFSAYALVHVEENTAMWLYHNGVQVEESNFYTSVQVGSGGYYIADQGSRTVVNRVFNCWYLYQILPFFDKCVIEFGQKEIFFNHSTKALYRELFVG